MIHTGTIMDISKSKTYVFTKACDMVLIRTKKEYMLGQQITFSNQDIVHPLPIIRLNDYRVLAAAALIVLVFTAALLNSVLSSVKPAFDTMRTAVISIDINPSIELSVNKDNKIIEVVFANEEGRVLTDRLALNKKPVAEGIDQIVALAREKGYLDEDGLLFISAAPDDIYNLTAQEQLKEILKSAEQTSEADIVTVYIDDKRIIDEAAENNISIGRLLLHKYAEDYGYSLSLEEIKDSSISDIFDKLRLDGQSEPLLQQAGEPDATQVPPMSPSPSPNDAAPSQTPSAAPSAISFSANVRVTAGEKGVTVTWNKAPNSEKFSYYKIVASLSNSAPVYPDDGYAAVIDIFDQTSTFLKTGSSYNGGDIGGTLVGGKAYYVSVTYVYENSVIRGNAVKVTIPKAPESAPSPSPSPTAVPTATPSSMTPKLTATVSNGKLNFSWTPLTGKSTTYGGTTYKNFSYYKVVASQTDSTPVYPENGYLYVGSDYKAASWTVDPSGGDYNQSPKLEPGVKYYFAITYVFENGKFVSNTVSVTVPDYEQAQPTTAPAMSVPQLNVSAEGSTLYFNWTPLPDSTITYNGETYADFKYYKVVASQTDSTPIYPENGYLYYASKLSSSSWSVTPSMDNYNKSPKLEAGKTYYFAITYVFSNGKFTSNTVQCTVPGATETSTLSFSSPSLTVSSDGVNLTFSWSKLPDNKVIYNGTTYEDFQYYKVVASETNPNPVYPDDGYLTYFTDLSSNGWTIAPQSAGLESGKTYYFSITYVFGNGKFVSNTVQLTTP